MQRTTRTAGLITLLAMAMTGLAQTAAGQSKEERAIRAASEAWQRYVAKQDVDSIVGLHTSDAVVMFANAPVMRGSVAIRSGWSDIVKLPGLKMHWTPTRIDVASPTRATEFGTYTDSYDTPSGRVSDAGTYVTIWHKVRGKWRVALDAPVSTQPAAATTSGVSDSQSAAITDSIRRATDAFVQAGSRVDPDAVFAFFSRSPGFAAADNGTLYTSLDKLREVYTGIYKGLRSNDLQVGDSRITILSPTAAVETFTGTFAPVDTAGNKAAARPLNLTMLWVREPGGWKILQIHQSFAPAR